MDQNRPNNATLTSAANGVPVLNIAAPNAKGLSHNQFDQYDVGKAGLILNNSTEKLAQSQLAGYLSGNTQLNGQAASVILNEVTGANRSQLNGYTEVLGKQANVIVANPYGITCDGCGFINTSRATLTTGVPQFQNGLLSGFDIRQGDVTISGLGLDGTGQDYFDILSRTAKINADIHANNLSVVTGPNQIDYQTNTVTATHTSADQPALAIDSSALGGMYAGRISLVATEQGVGVNTGKLFSSVGDIQLSADGQITLGDVRSQQSLKVISNQSVSTTGTQQAGQQIAYAAADSLHLNGENSATRFQASAGEQINLNGLVNAGKSASFQAKSVSLAQAETAAQHIEIQADTLALNQSTLTAGVTSDGSETNTGTVSIQAAEATLSDSAVQVSGQFHSGVSQLALNAGSTIAAEQVEFTDADNLINNGQIAAKQSLQIASDQSLKLSGSGKVSADSLSIQASQISNQSQLTAQSEMTVQADALTNDGKLMSAGSQQIISDTLENAGTLASVGTQQIKVSGQLLNTGHVQAAGDQSLTAQVFAQQGDVSGDGQIQINAGSMINDGTLTSLKDIRITAGDQLTNKGSLVAQGHTELSAGGTLTNQATGLVSGNSTTLNANGLNNQGTLQALTNLMATLTQFTNQGATLGMQDTTLNVAGNLSNTGLLYAGNTGSFYVKGDLVNTEGDVLTGGNMMIAGDTSGALSKSVQNLSGVIQSGDDLEMKAENIVNKRKVLEIQQSSGEGIQLDPHYNRNEFTVGKNSKYAPSYKYETECREGRNGDRESCSTSLYVTYDSHSFVVENEKLVIGNQSAASQIIAGGNASLTSNTLKNDASLIQVNQNLNLTTNTLDNKGYKTGVYTTTATYRLKSHDGIKSFTYGLTGKNTTESGVSTISSTISSGGKTVLNVKNKLNNSDIQSDTGSSNAGRPSKQLTDTTASGSQLDILNTEGSGIAFPDFRLPTTPNGLFIYNNGPDSHYLIETNPMLTNLDQFLGSDYFFDSIGFSPEKDLKVLGDAYYDTQTITTAIFEQTGKRYLHDDVGTDLAQMQQLLDNAGQQKHSLNLQAGIALTPEQVAGLTQDIVWWEPVEVKGQQVLAPKLYLSKVTQDNLDGGALISGAEVYAKAGNIVNSGQMDSQGKLHLVSDDSISNLGGSMTAGDDIALVAVNDIQNISGAISGENIALTTENGDIINRTEVERISITQDGTVTTAENASGVVYTGTRVGDTATISGRGKVTMNAGGSIINTAANVSAGSDLSFTAEKDIILAAETDREYMKMRDQEQLNVAVLGSSVFSGGDLSVDAGENISVTASDMEIRGKLAMVAGWDVALDTLVNESFSSETSGNSKSVSHLRQHQRTQMAANDGVFIQSGNNLTATGSQIITKGDVVALAKGDVTFQAVNDSEYHHDETTRKKSFGRKETHIQESLTETVVGADVTAGGKIIVKAQKFDDVQMAGGDSDITLIGANFKAGEGIEASADGSVGVYAQQYRTFSRNEKIKKGFGGFSGSHKSDLDSATLLNASGMMSSDNIDITSGKTIELIASEVEAGGDINASAVDEVIIAAGQESRQRETFEQEYGAFRGGDLFAMDSARQGEIHNTAKGSALTSGGAVNVKGGIVTVIGADVSAETDASFTADTGSVAVLAAEETHTTWSSSESLSVDVKDALKSVVNPYESVNFDDGQAKLTLAKADYEKSDSKTDATTHRGASIMGKGTVLMNAAEDILIEGSEVLADADEDGHGNIELTAANDVLIREVTDTQTTQSSNTKGNGELSLVVQHQSVETGKAAIALKESADKLKQANRDYRQYKKQLDSLEDTLSSLAQALANHEPGVDAADVDELKGIIKEVKNDEAFYLASITLATADLASKTTLLIKQGAAAAQSTSTLGFDAGLHLDMSVAQTDSQSTSTTARGSSLAGQNIVVKSGTQTDQQVLVQGSVLKAKEEVVLDGDTVNVVAAQQTQSGQSSTESGTIGASMTVHGSSTGGSLNASLNLSEQRSQSTSYVNSGVSGSTITINSRGDANIEGANVDAVNALNLDIGGDLNVASVQNRHSASHQGAGISGGASVDESASFSGMNGGLNASKGRSVTSDTLLTTLTSGGTADINVAGNTDITGALVATVDEDGNDLGNLALTTGSLTFRDLNNTDYRQDMSGGLTSSVGLSGSIDWTKNTTTLQYKNTSSYSKDKTLATLGQGEISIADDSDLTALNRDSSTISRDLFDVDRQQGNVDVTLDHRLLTEDGWKEIKEDVKRNGIFVDAVVDTAQNESIGLLGDAAKGVENFFAHQDNKQKFFTATKNFVTEPQNEALVAVLNDSHATPEQKQAAYAALSGYVSAELGIPPAQALLAVVDTFDGDRRKGAYANGTFYVDDREHTRLEDVVTTVGHETQHHIDAQRGHQGEGETYDDNREQYAEVMGEATQDYLSFNYGNADKGEFGGWNTQTGTKGSELIAQNQSHFESDRQSGEMDFRLPNETEQSVLKKLAGDDPDKQLELLSAACSLLNCAKEFALDSPERTYYEQLEREGQDNRELKQLLQNQFVKEWIVSFSPNMAYETETPQFRYSKKDNSEDLEKFGFAQSASLIAKGYDLSEDKTEQALRIGFNIAMFFGAVKASGSGVTNSKAGGGVRQRFPSVQGSKLKSNTSDVGGQQQNSTLKVSEVDSQPLQLPSAEADSLMAKKDVNGRQGSDNGRMPGESVVGNNSLQGPTRGSIRAELDKLPDGQGDNYTVRQNANGSFSAVRKDVNQGHPVRVSQEGNLYSPTASGEPIPNAVEGNRRNFETEAELNARYPEASVQPEQYLRDSDGRIVKDPLTGEGRRIDHVVIQNGKVIDSAETTSLSARKEKQSEKEKRIRDSGGKYVRDRETGCLVEIYCETRIIRRE
ncbi:hemagglutinin repeat-containing protein [Photobacterium sp. CCB-ST2H9]|uniref:two-partner secretion domain-containing protein n=1 Tax=Photobacterium sp. CCB-ST2H9 TaxID=2912855 RepID=UPI002002FB12|nr:hemagglutinin repeat-containing protein [Photobacterium sp. CCB-ST2H9]UTM59457.1 hemagglutinin repeat-containing protein [Photobacterium sp. CCB-ST2H9]